MSLAYVITAFKLPDQFRLLLDALWHPDDRFAVHIDAKTPEAMRRQFEAGAEGRPNVRFIPSIPVVWGGFSLCQAEWNALNALVEWGGDWTHVMNITGQDFPLRTRDAMLAELARAPTANFADVRVLKNLPRHFRRRTRWVSVETKNRLIRLPIPLLQPRSFRNEWYGVGFHILSRSFCEWAVRALLAEDCLRFYRHTYHPHEQWIQAMLMNGPFADTVIRDNRREIRWIARRGNPAVFTMADLPMLARSPAFFARKFDQSVDADILCALARRLRGDVGSATGDLSQAAN